MKNELVKGIVKDVFGKIYVEVPEQNGISGNYKLSKESLIWEEGEKIYAKKDGKRKKGVLYAIKQGEALLPKNPDSYVIRPTEQTIKCYSRFKENQHVLGIISNGKFNIK